MASIEKMIIKEANLGLPPIFLASLVWSGNICHGEYQTPQNNADKWVHNQQAPGNDQ